ncbi:MAG: hypothetical protein CVU05_02280 [Bacteroidetes bacterium HGW-Bacteroidetes-21]|nr:MAG: hypothetical protein CVU05_02280 [Bacteroidetes bacterium HGW-Bacteroidetes-21]
MKWIYNILSITIFSLLLISCKTTYRINPDKVKHMSDRRIIRNMMDKYISYNTISYKFNGEFADSAKSTSFNGTLRIKYDSLIWVSIQVALGVEYARIQITKDSIYFMNKFKDEYFVKGIDYIGNLFQVDLNYEMLQSILTNELFLYADKDESDEMKEEDISVNDDEPDIGNLKKTFKADTDSNMYVLKTHRKRKLKKQTRRNKPGIIVQSFRIIPEIFKINEADIYDVSEKRKLNISYSNFVLNGTDTMPNTLKIAISDKTKDVSLMLNYNKVTINSDVSFPFNIPEKFKPIQMKD